MRVLVSVIRLRINFLQTLIYSSKYIFIFVDQFAIVVNCLTSQGQLQSLTPEFLYLYTPGDDLISVQLLTFSYHRVKIWKVIIAGVNTLNVPTKVSEIHFEKCGTLMVNNMTL